LASGDPFSLEHFSGSGTTFSYTPAASVWLCITSVQGYIYTVMLNGTGTPYIYGFIESHANNETNNNPLKKIFGDGTGIYIDHASLNTNGAGFSGIEL
tara:strand:+ start:2020 stop:2313 length:294 start_codon:yes stop_codon:yes gene_type:complete